MIMKNRQPYGTKKKVGHAGADYCSQDELGKILKQRKGRLTPS